MSYTIYLDNEMLDSLSNENVEVEFLEKDDEKIIKIYEFEQYVRDFYNVEDVDAFIAEAKKNGDLSEILNNFKESDYWEEYVNSRCYPMYNMHYVLQSKNCNYEMPLFLELEIPSVTVNNILDLEVCVLSLTGCGMDFSESLELAYYVFDGVSPFMDSHIYYLDDKLKELLLFCREKVKEQGSVAFTEIKKKWREINA